MAILLLGCVKFFVNHFGNIGPLFDKLFEGNQFAFALDYLERGKCWVQTKKFWVLVFKLKKNASEMGALYDASNYRMSQGLFLGMGYATWQPLLELLFWYPLILFNSLKDWVTVVFIY